MSATPLSLPALIAALSIPDLTDPDPGAGTGAGEPHSLQLLVGQAIAALSEAWRCDQRVIRSRPIVPITDNYDALGYEPTAIARDERYTRYVSDTCVLRSHTSSGIPPALRRLARELDPPEQVLLAVPGMCYRRDSIDRLHTGTPHQLDLWLLRRGGRRLDHDDMSLMVGRLVAALLPGRHWRWTAASHPYTVDGRQVDVIDGGEAIEIAECGPAEPAVLARAGLDPASWSGLALGTGLDRILMLRKGIPDIRLLRSADPRVASQMRDLSPYQPVSRMPAARRDLSVAVEPGADAEVLGDRVREALDEQADLVEEVSVLAVTPYEDVPAAARARLGIHHNQVNMLLRVMLRSVDRTLTSAEVNALRADIYRAVHQGDGEGSAAAADHVGWADSDSARPVGAG